ncbi:MAG TPA: sigma-54 dependent transcriptional regulator [Gammaproteobacteria bacterium]|nr:sigma-54 dependent transcriptional regulator [Gammaproteobacteria bacterium]
MSKEPNRARILLVEDSASQAAVYTNYLAAEGYDTEAVDNGADALAHLETQTPDIVLLDLRLPDMSGMEILRHIQECDMDSAVIIITAHGSIDTAVEAMRHGATDFIAKPFDATRLRVTVGNVLDKRRLSNMVISYQQAFERNRFHGFVGASIPMQAVYRIIESAAPSRATVFITGESGTGKELCAQAIHRESPRHSQAFIALNCAAIPRDLMESEIFGHVKGAFTGAFAQRDGAATRADGGTLFLDEICEMDIDLQGKLLRFIQTGHFQRVGDSKEEWVDIRILCATNRDPLREVKAGRFREDLYYRLNVIPINLPPLRDRDDDIIMIANDMLLRMSSEENKDFKDISSEAAAALQGYFWPGNVRELENVIRNIIVLNDGSRVTPDMLPSQVKQLLDRSIGTVAEKTPGVVYSEPVNVTPSAGQVRPSEIRPLWLEEKDIIERTIDLCDGNIPRAAALLKISASTIYRKRVAWGKVGEC